MGYNGNNRRLRTNVFSRRQTRQGCRIMGNLLIGALGAGVAAGRGLSEASRNRGRSVNNGNGCSIILLLLASALLFSMCH